MTDWNKDTIHETVLRQKNFFMSNQTLDVRWRLAQLKKLKDAVIRYRSRPGHGPETPSGGSILL